MSDGDRARSDERKNTDSAPGREGSRMSARRTTNQVAGRVYGQDCLNDLS
jgi:hypothetical protein